MMTDNRSIDIQILSTPLMLAQVQQQVSSEGCGGLVFFVGDVRNQTKGKQVLQLEFEAFEPMAIKEMRKIAEDMMRRWPAQKVVFYHRVGVLEVGDTAVIIGVACPHRKSAFEACEYAIDTLKQTVPIWKKEIFEDGVIWVAAHP